jgi:hypothetical protein
MTRLSLEEMPKGIAANACDSACAAAFQRLGVHSMLRFEQFPERSAAVDVNDCN